jgi:hypothetical protein
MAVEVQRFEVSQSSWQIDVANDVYNLEAA